MNRDSKFQIISLFLVPLSLISFYFASILKPFPSEIFRLSFNPLNVETNAIVDLEENSITFQTLNQTLIIRNLNSGILKMTLTFSGGLIVDEIDLTLPNFQFELNQIPVAVGISSLVQHYEHQWAQLHRGDISIQFQNFVKIEEQMYSLILSDITIVQQP